MATKKKPDLAAGRRLLASAAFKARCEGVLEGWLGRHPDIDVLSVSSVDGRNVVCIQRGEFQPGRIAALSATLMSVSESLSREVGGEGVDHALLALKQGVVVSRRLADRTGIFTLSLFGSTQLNLALALRAAIDVADVLVGVIDSEIETPSLAVSVA